MSNLLSLNARLKTLERSNADVTKWSARQMPDFPTWLRVVSPDYVWHTRHHLHLIDALNAITAGTITKLAISLPPRHGKSELAKHYMAWRLCRQPKKRVILASYSAELANTFARQTKRLASEYGLPLGELQRADSWETYQHGGLRSAGVGGSITGFGGDLLTVDDPIKNREDSLSVSYRDKLWHWFQSDLYTRLEPGGAVFVIATRWHTDDLIGRLQQSENADEWHFINIPALAEENDVLGRAPGEALWPERFKRNTLEETRSILGSSFDALYQGRPLDEAASMFKREWFQPWAAPELPKIRSVCRFWDLASSGRGDFTAGVLMGQTNNNEYVILDVQHAQMTSVENENLIRRCADEDRESYSQVVIAMEQEPGSSGLSVIDHYRRNILAGHVFKGVKSTGPKAIRAAAFSAMAEGGHVYLMPGAWRNKFLNEITRFPLAKHDDMVDAASGAFNELASGMQWAVW